MLVIDSGQNANGMTFAFV